MAIERHQQCGKQRYETQRQAISRAISSSRRGGRALRVYMCPTCHGWHLTKRSEWRKPRPKKAVESKPPLRDLNALGHLVGCPCGQCAWLDEPGASSA